jgi:glycosyltransferase involved in cell wall biosynthesis
VVLLVIPRYAIVLTHNRPELLAQCVAAIREQSDFTIVIDNASDPPVALADFPDPVNILTLIRDPEQPPNLSRLWNRGFDTIMDRALSSEWDVAVLCDDVIVPDGWFETVATGMRANGAAAASTHQWSEVHAPILKQAPDNDLNNRMCGWAFVVAGEKNLRADEDLKWWWCDTDMDWQARNSGGMVIVPGPVAKNIHPNDFTYRVPGLAEQTGVDGLTFTRKWGGRPW